MITAIACFGVCCAPSQAKESKEGLEGHDATANEADEFRAGLIKELRAGSVSLKLQSSSIEEETGVQTRKRVLRVEEVESLIETIEKSHFKPSKRDKGYPPLWVTANIGDYMLQASQGRILVLSLDEVCFILTPTNDRWFFTWNDARTDIQMPE
ncbi:MAG: hypothetical protein KDB07_10455 [Planctomycetes bacterium]|nr:hypothetical protein [Planctomycetota bacterium]